MNNQKQEQNLNSADKRLLAKTLVILFLCFAYLIWLRYSLHHMEFGQRPFYTAAYLFGFVLCNLILPAFAGIARTNSNDNYVAPDSYNTKVLEKTSRFGIWYARRQDYIDFAFLLEFGYFIMLFGWADNPYFYPKDMFHIVWGIWLLVSTTVAVRGYFALRNVPKIKSDIELEYEAEWEDEFEEIYDEEESFKVLKWLGFILRYGGGLLSIGLWL